MAQPPPPDPEPDPDHGMAALASRRRTVLFTAVGAVVAAVLLVAIVVRVQSTSPDSAGGGAGGGTSGATFDVGDAEQRAASIARDGPLLFADPQGRTRDIYVQHLGGTDWVAFEARASGAPRQCVLEWDGGARRFVDPCDARIYPPDGAGLVTFPARVDDDGRVIVDLSRPSPPAAG